MQARHKKTNGRARAARRAPQDEASRQRRQDQPGNRENLKVTRIPRNSLLTLPQGVGLSGILPDRFITRLRYWKQGSDSLAVTAFATHRYRPSSAFDVDPTVGGTSMAGFTELATLYGSYRVTFSRAKLEVINPSVLTPFEAMLAPVNVDPGASPSGAYSFALREQPYCVSKSVPLAGGPMAVLTNSMSTEKIYGTEMIYTDDNFSSLVTTSPVNNWFWVLSFNTANLIPTNSIQWTLTVDVTVEFFDRLFLLT